MKLLLTSAGFTNQRLVEALVKLADKKSSELTVAFVPTAADIEPADKSWLINDLTQIQKIGFGSVDVVDIAALPDVVCQERLAEAQVLIFGGGNTFFLRYWLEERGLLALLPELLQSRIYVGISAGSIVTGPEMPVTVLTDFYMETVGEYRLPRGGGLNLVDFYTFPHLDSVYFPRVREAELRSFPGPGYVLDDRSAVIVDGETVEIVGGGTVLRVDGGDELT